LFFSIKFYLLEEMKNILLIFLLLILCRKGSPQETDKIAEIEKEKYLKTFNQKELNYPGDSSYNVIYYKLDLDISYSPQHLSGEVTVSAKSLVNELSSFFLDLSNTLTVDSIKSGDLSAGQRGKNLLFEHAEGKLTVQLERIYNLDEEFSVTVFYQGIPEASGLGSFVFDIHNGQPSIWTVSEPYGASDWWSCKDSPSDKADSADIWITSNSDFFAVSNGSLTEVVDNRNGTFTYKWKSSYPIANYLISLAISEYTVYQQHFNYSLNDSMPVVHYIYPEIFPAIKEQLDKTILMLQIFSDRFGLYPFIREKYGHASFGRGGMEHQTISSMGIFSDGVISHELAHQWFGDKVTCKDWQHIWLNEGFATFSEGVYIEAVSGKDAYNSFIDYQMSRSKTAKGSIYVQDISSISEIFNGAKSYSKGAVVLHMLRGITGDSLFFRILKNYLNDPQLAYGVATTEDFQRNAEEVYSSSLDYFFQQWIYGENYPHYYVRWDYTPQSNNLFEIELSIEQTDNTFPRFFIMPVQIEIATTIKDTIVTLFNDQQNQSFKFYVEGEPTNFMFDPGNYILSDTFIDDPRDLTIPDKFNLEQNYPNPFNNSTTIIFQSKNRERVILKVFDILGNEVAVIFNEEVEAGEYEVEFSAIGGSASGGDGRGLSSGIYFYKMYAGDFIETKKLVLLK
ncbi:MAG: M1 family aminopeptidase, partial [Ignavibacteria bacterium]|nr:M1 family aminopeptidase [Ignavibacteria bacterium]